jgi:hypothetical protein
LAKRGNQELPVLHDRNQVILNLHAPLSVAPCSFQSGIP